MEAGGYVDMWICGYVDMWICGYVDMRICEYAGKPVDREDGLRVMPTCMVADRSCVYRYQRNPRLYIDMQQPVFMIADFVISSLQRSLSASDLPRFAKWLLASSPIRSSAHDSATQLRTRSARPRTRPPHRVAITRSRGASS